MSYLDIDDILCEEEMIPVTTLFHFKSLDFLAKNHQISNKKRRRDEESTSSVAEDGVLPANTKLKLPFWMVQNWASLNFISLKIPKIYSTSILQKLEADACQADIHSLSSYYFLFGAKLVKFIVNNNNNNTSNAAASSRIAFAELKRNALLMKKALIKACTGERLCRSLDWSMSSIGEDVSQFTKKLDVLEKDLFISGLVAVQQHVDWKVHGSRFIPVSTFIQKWHRMCRVSSSSSSSSRAGSTKVSTTVRAVSPETTTTVG